MHAVTDANGEPTWLALHARVLNGDDGALEALSGRMLRVLPGELRRRFRSAPLDVVMDSVVDAILDYTRAPTRFDATRSVPLDRFIGAAALRNLQDRLRSDTRRRAREERYAQEQQRTVIRPRDSPEVVATRVRRSLAAVCKATELGAAMAWASGASRTALAAELGLLDLSAVDQQREVKRFKDRLVRRFARSRRAGCMSNRY